jgi:tetratricopeptide (TPR) repeat protein
MFAGVIAGVLLSAAPAGEPPGRREALARYGAAVWQARKDRLLSAAKSLEQSARLDPDAAAPRRELVRVYALIGREPEAIRVARLVLEKSPHDVDTAHTLARLLHDVGEVKEAAAVAKRAADAPKLTDRPDKALAVLRDLATLSEAANDLETAEDALRRAVALFTEDRQAVERAGPYNAKEADAEAAASLERLGKVLVKRAKYDAAADAFRAAHALAGDAAAAPRLDWNLATALAAKGDAAAALPHLAAFLKLRPRNLEPYETLATVLRDAGRGGEVVGELQRLLAADPKNLHLAAALAAELARDEETRGQADALFAQVLDATADPKVVRAVVRSHVETGRAGLVVGVLDAGYAAAKGDDPDGADKRRAAADKVRAVADVLRAEPEWAAAVVRAAHDELRAGTKRLHQTWHAMGVLAAHHRRLELAAVQFRQAVRKAPKETESDAYAGLLGVLRRGHKSAEIVQVCEDGLQSAQFTSPVLFNYYLAPALADLGEERRALEAADKAVAQAGDTDRLTVRLQKAWVLKALGRWDDAAALCRTLLDEFDAPADRNRVRYVLAGALWGAKRHAAAEAEYRAVLDDDPDHAGACNDLGYHLADRGRNLAEAERLVRHAVAVDRADRRRAGDPEPDNAAYLDSLGWVLFRRGDPAAAREHLEKAAALPDGAADAVVWDHLGDVHFRLGDRPKAKAAWDTAAALYATDARGKRDGRLDSVRKKLALIK